ncbi:pimeloyl-ACP methyl ester carboxylesterase [Ochrobactrum sp. 19YEA23]|uniref:acetoin dehydrogenase dihydrolipoyllysine-residue acetyltransferase subunit n=1 Tax=Ochrobactrum sp. 19YEA23 TaxID=3039854 RepID=UPI00247A7DB0|nr:pimeloyl-ACP methyl ester carboxylesterase [Ochrobactrum sp. 19YEA23]
MSERILKMPRLGETMEEGKIVGFLVKPGDSFKRGDSIIEIETDKTVAEFPALGDGTLNEWIGAIGDHVVVGAPLARIDIGTGPDWTSDGDDEAPDAQAAIAQDVEAVQEAVEASVAKPAASPNSGERVRATPLARKVARQNGIDINSLSGSGRRGRIEKEDVLAASSGSKSNSAVHFADLANGRVAYLDQGPKNGRTILLLHGFSGDRTTWSGIAAGLRRANCRVIVPDLPAHGLTTIDVADAAELSTFLPAFLDALGIAGVDVVAHSLGAVAATKFADVHPDRVSSLTLIAPAGLGSEVDAGFISGMANATTAGEVSHLLRRIAAKPVELSPELAAEFAKTMAKGRLKALSAAIVGPSGQTSDIVPALERLSRAKPVRVLVGLLDRIIPWQQATALPSSIAVHFLGQSGHMPQWDQSKEVLDLIINATGGSHD